MTAGQIASALGLQNVEIEYMASEVLYTDWFTESPIPNLEYVKNGCSF
jgi:hypothetical protein